ncbi:unnamed protein product, partial [Didymodactylos carnosus]
VNQFESDVADNLLTINELDLNDENMLKNRVSNEQNVIESWMQEDEPDQGNKTENVASIVLAHQNMTEKIVAGDNLTNILQSVENVITLESPGDYSSTIVDEHFNLPNEMVPELSASTAQYVSTEDELANMKVDNSVVLIKPNEMNASQSFDPFDDKSDAFWNNFATVSEDPFVNNSGNNSVTALYSWKNDLSNNVVESRVVDPTLSDTSDLVNDTLPKPPDQNTIDILAKYLPANPEQKLSNDLLEHDTSLPNSKLAQDSLYEKTVTDEEEEALDDYESHLTVDPLGTKMKYSFTAPVIDDSADDSSIYDDYLTKKNEIVTVADDLVSKALDESKIAYSQDDTVQANDVVPLNSDDTDSDEQHPTEFEVSGSNYPLNATPEDFTSLKPTINQEFSESKDDAWITDSDKKPQKTLLLGDEPWELDLPTTKSSTSLQAQVTDEKGPFLTQTDSYTNFFTDAFNPPNKSATTTTTNDTKFASVSGDEEEPDNYDVYFKSTANAVQDEQKPFAETVRFDNVENQSVTGEDTLESSTSSSSSNASAINEMDVTPTFNSYDADRITHHMENIPSTINTKDEIKEKDRLELESTNNQKIVKEIPTEPLNKTVEITASNATYRAHSHLPSDDGVENKPPVLTNVEIRKPSGNSLKLNMKDDY